MIVNRVLFVPKYYTHHESWAMPTWEDPQVFGSSGPIHIEYCSGNGAWILEKALQYPDVHWIAVEKRFDRVQKIWAKMRNFEIKNLFIVCGDALTFTRHYVPGSSFQAVFVNFPDPWPKEKHAKNRLLQEPFLSEIERVSLSGAVTTIVTDHPHYATQVTDALCAHPQFDSVFPEPFYVTQLENYGTSYFDALWRERGLTIHYMQFTKREKQ